MLTLLKAIKRLLSGATGSGGCGPATKTAGPRAPLRLFGCTLRLKIQNTLPFAKGEYENHTTAVLSGRRAWPRLWRGRPIAVDTPPSAGWRQHKVGLSDDPAKACNSHMSFAGASDKPDIMLRRRGPGAQESLKILSSLPRDERILSVRRTRRARESGSSQVYLLVLRTPCF